MATFVVFLLCSKLFLPNIVVQAATHWVVTEDGRIQAQLDSVYNMRRPYDLMSVLKQEQRAETLDELKKELIDRKEEIDRSEDKDTGLEKRFYESDADCVIAGKPLPEYDLYISTVLPLENKGIKPEDYIDFSAAPSTEPVPPDCTKYGVTLQYSPHAFEHLQGMKSRSNLTGNPELGLKNAITHRDNVDDYGNLVFEAMMKDQESWVLYNMAAFYWRIKGNPYHVIECVRRALHFSPRLQKDVALISLANVLHRAHYSNEAAIVVHAALDVSRDLNVNHFTLGNIYAVLRDYNKSVICFENTLKIQPDFEAAAKRKHAVMCHAKLEVALEKQHNSLQQTLDDLKDYQRKHESWQQQQDWLLSEQASEATRQQQKTAYDEFKARELEVAMGYGEYCTGTVCRWGKKHITLTEDDFVPNTDLPILAEDSGDVDYMNPVRPPMFPEKHPQTPEILQKLAFKNKDWPSKDECDTYVQKFPAWNEHPTTYLSPENKGFEVKALLAEAQGLEKGTEHPLPWYPPVCATLTDIPEGPRSYDHIESVKDRTKIPLRLYDTSKKQTLLDHVDGHDMTEEEVGQRILTALKRKIGPSWVLYNLAGLYWRIYGNNYHGIECIRRALYFAPAEYQDVPLVNLANILYKWGRVDDALLVMKDAVQVNELEPDSHFFLGSLLAAKGNMTGSIYHFEEALAQSALHRDAFESLRVIKCYQKYHRTSQSKPPPESPPAKAPLASCGGKTGLDATLNENKLTCRKENGKETCTLETKPAGCDSCRQMCTVTPVPMATCGKHVEDPNHVVNVMGGDKKDMMCAEGKCEFLSTDLSQAPWMPPVNGEQCRNNGPPQYMPISDELGNNPLLDEGFSERLDDISDYYRQKGVCTGDDCHKLMLQCFTPFTNNRVNDDSIMFVKNIPMYINKIPHSAPIAAGTVETCLPANPYYGPGGAGTGNQKSQVPKSRQISSIKESSMVNLPSHPGAIKYHKPHTKLEILDGVLHQKLIFVDNMEELVVADHDCVIFNSGDKSVGCDRPEFKPFESEIYNYQEFEYILDMEQENLDEILWRLDASEFDLFPKNVKISGFEDITAEAILENARQTQNELEKSLNKLLETTNSLRESLLGSGNPGSNELDLAEELQALADQHQRQAAAPTAPITGRSSYTDEEIIKLNPDATRHIESMPDLQWPEYDWCKKNFRQFNHKQFLSTWVSVTTKGIQVDEHIDFTATIHQTLPPVCDTRHLTKALPVDLLDSLKDPSALSYGAESGLKESLQKLGGRRSEAAAHVGTRIALALIKRPTSWVLTNLAALYWRVEGDAPKAIDCIKLAYEYSPASARDLPMLGLANILFRSDRVDDAIRLVNVALEHGPDLVVSHFTIANLFAAKYDWGKAINFYQATLALQQSFKPAKDRLISILCEKMLSNPHIFRPTAYPGEEGNQPAGNQPYLDADDIQHTQQNKFNKKKKNKN